MPDQVLEVASVGKQVALVRVDKPVAYLDIDDTGLVEAGYGPEAVMRLFPATNSPSPCHKKAPDKPGPRSSTDERGWENPLARGS